MPEPEYLHPSPASNYIPAICSVCGAQVARDGVAMGTHNQWHAMMDELIEWAQMLDKKLFPDTPQKSGIIVPETFFGGEAFGNKAQGS